MEFWVQSFDTLSDIRALLVELFGVSIKKDLSAWARMHTHPTSLTTVSGVVNNSPKRNLNTMNLGD